MIVIRVSPECHQKLFDMSLKRSAELGRRVSMGFVIEEILEREAELQKEHGPESGEIFGALD